MGSQGMYDWKNTIRSSDDAYPFSLEDFRGGKLFSLDPVSGLMTDRSATMTRAAGAGPGEDGAWTCHIEFCPLYGEADCWNGVTVPHEGILTLEWMETRGLLVAMTHPGSNLVFVDPALNQIVRFVNFKVQFPGTIGMDNRIFAAANSLNPHATYGFGGTMTEFAQTPAATFSNGFISVPSREIVIDQAGGNKIYMHRGNEEGSNNSPARPIWVYDYSAGTFTVAGSARGGMWGGAAPSPDGTHAFVTHNDGWLTKIDFVAGTAAIVTGPGTAGRVCSGTWYWLIPSEDFTELFFKRNHYGGNERGLRAYNIANNTVRTVVNSWTSNADQRVFTGQVNMLQNGKAFTIGFGNNNSWSASNSNFTTNANQASIYVYNDLAPPEPIDP